MPQQWGKFIGVFCVAKYHFLEKRQIQKQMHELLGRRAVQVGYLLGASCSRNARRRVSVLLVSSAGLKP